VDDDKNVMMDGNVLRQLKALTVHPEFYYMLSTDLAAAKMMAHGNDMMKNMYAAGHGFDAPRLTDAIKKAKEAEGAKLAKMEASDRRMNQEGGSGATVNDLNLMRESDPTGGMSFFYMATCRDPRVAMPATERANLLNYLLANSPKYAYMVYYLWRHTRLPDYQAKYGKGKSTGAGQAKKERVLIFFSSPLTQW